MLMKRVWVPVGKRPTTGVDKKHYTHNNTKRSTINTRVYNMALDTLKDHNIIPIHVREPKRILYYWWTFAIPEQKNWIADSLSTGFSGSSSSQLQRLQEHLSWQKIQKTWMNTHYRWLYICLYLQKHSQLESGMSLLMLCKTHLSLSQLTGNDSPVTSSMSF